MRYANILGQLPVICLATFLAGTTELTAQSDGPPAGRWTSVGNGASHANYYPATLGAGSLSAGWSKSFGRVINPVAISDGRVFVTATNMPVRQDTSESFAVALDSSSGQELWRTVLPAPADAPLVNDDTLLVEAEPLWAVYAIGCADGAMKWRHPFSSIIRTSTAPSDGDHLWLDWLGGNFASTNRVLAVRISDDVLTYVVPPGDGTGGGVSASFYSGVLYTSDGTSFRAVDPENGAVLWTLAANLSNGDAGNAIPAIANGRAAFLAQGSRLSVIDLSTQSVLWQTSSNDFTGRLANDGAVVYVVDGYPYNVKAYKADTGVLLGSYPLTGMGTGEQFVDLAAPLVTNDTVLIATDRETFIFDKASFALRTKLSVGGHLSYAAGKLYIADPTGNLLTYSFDSATPEAGAAAWPGPTPAQAPPQTEVELLSINQTATARGNGSSFVVSLNGDGRYVLFQSNATDLLPLPDTNNGSDYFLRDRQAGTVSLITTNASNTAAATASADLDGSGAVSIDGSIVVFDSTRPDLVSPSPAAGRYTYARDVVANHTTLLGLGAGPKLSRDGKHVLFSHVTGPNDGSFFVYNLSDNTVIQNSDYPGVDVQAISEDGRIVLFLAPGTKTNLQGYPALQCFVRDMVSQTTTLISVDASGSDMANGDVLSARMSEDGQLVIFESNATNLVSAALTTTSDGYSQAIYRRDLRAGATDYLTSGLSLTTLGNVSSDGEIVAFAESADFSSTNYVFDGRTGATTKLPYGDLPSMDKTGRFFALSSFGVETSADLNNTVDICLYDRTLDKLKLISHNLAGSSSPSGIAAQYPLISDDGQAVAFASTAFDLVVTPEDPSQTSDSQYDAYVVSSPLSGDLLNISTRAEVGTGDSVLIGGFIIPGTDSRKVAIRALGPSLAASGVAGAITDPVLELHDSMGALIAMNDNWNDDPTDIQAAGLAPTNPAESALVRILPPGAYTAIVRATNGSAGIGLVELYDLSSSTNGSFANISTRGLVGSGDDVLIGGFITGSDDGGSAKVLVRAVGPSLISAGTEDAIADPTLELHDSNGTLIGANDNWKDSQQSTIEATGIPPGDDRESAILVTLSPGAYTAIVGSKSGDGVGLIEVYRLQ